MKRVGIITFHCSYNYGSALQTYALQCFVENLNYDVEIIDYVLNSDFEHYKLFRRALYKTNRKAFVADLIFLLPHIKRRNSFKRFVKSRLHLTNGSYSSLDMPEKLQELNNRFDIFVCGSDQIWNIDCTNGVVPPFFLSFADDNKLKIAYAPSLSHVGFRMDVQDEMKKLIEGLDWISIREESTLSYVQSLTTKDVKVVLDPTLILDSQYYYCLIDKIKKESGKYIFVYMLEPNQELIEYCDEMCKKKNIKMYYITSRGYRGFKTGHNLYGISPEEFLYYIANAQYVITNSFHATVFSILFNKQFCTFETEKSNSRMVDLLEKLNITERLYHSQFDIEKSIDYLSVMDKLDNLRKDSIEYLTNALKGGNKNE
ncbi:MAG: polysaccharide pyruvyl transferase family protein [Lachnospiraceae bacterium]|nr:polysaccharide pyruvyl transferase family protein [Lachnospiraceae bacterium]